MNGTDISPTNVGDYPEGQSREFQYLSGLLVAVLLFIIITTYSSYVCTRSCSRLPSTQGNYPIGTITTISTERNSLSAREKGIDENTLRQYPKVLYSDAKLQHGGLTTNGCSICLSDYKDSDMIRILPRCAHIFHLNCIDRWLRLHTTCPICRTPPGPILLATPSVEVVSLGYHLCLLKSQF